MNRSATKRGKFITVEGIEGVGKSTHLRFIADTLREHGKTVTTTREPGGTPVAEKIREILLRSERGTISGNCELLLMFAARESHLSGLIGPALARGDWVVCDRFTDATYAYQGAGRGLPEKRIATLEKWVQGTLTPDLTLLLDAPMEITRQRRRTRGMTDRFEEEDGEFFSRVQANYRQIAKHDPGRVKWIDASADIDTVQLKLRETLDAFVKKQG